MGAEIGAISGFVSPTREILRAFIKQYFPVRRQLTPEEEEEEEERKRQQQQQQQPAAKRVRVQPASDDDGGLGCLQ